MSLVSATHYEAVAAIRAAGYDMMMVVVKTDTSSPTDTKVGLSISVLHFTFSSVV